MRSTFSAMIAVFILIWITSQANAVEIHRATSESGTRFIVISGQFEYDDNPLLLKIAVEEFTPSFITFDSPGGNVLAAMEIGRAIRRLGLSTVQVRSSLCVSACSLAFLGGLDRMAEPGSIGVHQSSFVNIKLDSHVAVEAVQALTGQIIGYLVEMGADPRLLQLSLTTVSDDMRYLTAREMSEFKVTTGSSTTHFGLTSLPKKPALEATPNPSSPDLQVSVEERAAAFMITYHEAWSRPNREALSLTSSYYASSIDFYGKRLPRAEVITTKTQFAERWPLRAYMVRPETAEIDCNAEFCKISGVVDWFVESISRKASSAGTATFAMLWNAKTGQIHSEDGKVLSSVRKGAKPDHLLSRWFEENGKCRGGSGDDVKTHEACERRNAVDRLLANIGWCYGRQGEAGYQMSWHKCGPGSLQ